MNTPTSSRRPVRSTTTTSPASVNTTHSVGARESVSTSNGATAHTPMMRDDDRNVVLRRSPLISRTACMETSPPRSSTSKAAISPVANATTRKLPHTDARVGSNCSGMDVNTSPEPPSSYNRTL